MTKDRNGSEVVGNARLTIAVATLGMTAATIVQSVLVVTSVELTAVFDMGTFHFGALFASFSLSGALLASPAGRLIDSRPLPRTLAVFLIWAAVSLALLSLSPNVYVLWMAVMAGGVANAAGNLGTTKAVALNVRPEWQGLGVGIKQAGAYLSVLAAGLVPLLQPHVGWRYATLAVCVVPLATLPLVTRLRVPVPVLGGSSPGDSDGQLLGHLSRIAFLLACGISTTLSFAALFLVHASTLTPRAAGITVAVMGGFAAASRIFWGWRADLDLGKTLTQIAVLSAATMGAFIVGSWLSNTPLLVLGVLMGGASMLAWHSAGWLAVITISGPTNVGDAAARVLRATLLAFCVAPPLFGGLVTLLGDYLIPWVLMLGVTLAAYASTRHLRASPTIRSSGSARTRPEPT